VLPSAFLNPSLRVFLAIFSSGRGAYPLLSGLCDVLVGLEETADVQGLAAPDVTVDGPVEGELQRAAVERAGLRVRGMSHARIGFAIVAAHRIWGLVAMVGEVLAVAACQWV
jgi:hypothetical protein